MSTVLHLWLHVDHYSSEKYAEAVETISAIKDEKSLLGGIFKLRVGRFRRTSANNLFTKRMSFMTPFMIQRSIG